MCVLYHLLLNLSSQNQAERFRGLPEKSGLPITISESLIPGVDFSFLKLADIEVTNNHPKGFRVAWPMWIDKT